MGNTSAQVAGVQESVSAVAVVPQSDKVLPVTFRPNIGRKSDKAPTHYWTFPNKSIPGTMLVGNITKDAKSGQYRVRMPGENAFGDAIVCAKDLVTENGRVYGADNVQGIANLVTFPDKIRSAFLIYLETNKADHLVSVE